MRLLAMSGLLIASGCWAQEPPASLQRVPGQVQEQTPSAAEKQTLTIPAGTRIPLTLMNPIWAKTAKPGDSVRAVTAFPVTIGTQVMIPPGTYVEGFLDKVIKRDSTGYPGLRAHFTRIVFANGYALALEGMMARTEVPATSLPASFSAERQSPDGMEFGGGLGRQLQTGPTPPPLPPLPGPRYGPIIGLAAGGAAVMTVLAILAHRRLGDYVYFDAGWQFELILESPLELDAERVAAALAGPSAM
jgi:hypothetical protein